MENSKHPFIPYGRQSIDEDDIQAVVDVLKSDYLTTGPEVEKFEAKVADYVGAKYAVAFSNGTAALHAACFAACVGNGDEVITTPMTFVASANCVLYQGAKPVFADIDPETYNIDPDGIRKKINGNTKAILPVDFTGQPCNLDEIMELAKEHNLIVIEDAAHAIGATYKDSKVGSIADMTMFSFHPVKHITTGEGGMITTDNKDLYEKLHQFRTHGITRDPSLLNENDGPWYYEMQFLGYNYRITDIQAALGSSQLDKLEGFIERRREIVGQYNKAFRSLNELITPFQHTDGDSSWHLYVIQLKKDLLSIDRKQFFEELRQANIGVNVHYIPVHLQPYYQELGYKKGDYPIAEDLYEQTISLPLFPTMTNEDVQYVIDTVKGLIKEHQIG
ncbi:UDP-4-amino-4,6-dideoxy-N-acetyl-beta-L-altrosamine transaminase [Saliterribacillus persicus]|uniref:UDP-4-amino-4, 6-dideoxy-N-acetyl-beta-L-altrosamine transaminase n=1 Tax=Saliterribacillus persicus TaxID=930114 RepID=A0A368YAS5_9BACI|nr:UDP-4-amino-4,6-dideoxy-N-acetyl-beta-L-altrosamine transaminase [Saliterribacillus persicus]RCW77360.1 UDP-4-amino-4,6-dideoxy-N-acetyl-beta-L-altrosamine transaminase [Saliterribacillus persicus]